MEIVLNPYKTGDILASEETPDIAIGICTGFRHNDTCVDIDGKCMGGKNYFVKCTTIDLPESMYEII